MNNPFTRWWVIFWIVVVAIATALIGGIAQFILKNDVTYLSWLIIAMFSFASVHLGYKVKYEGKEANINVSKHFSDKCTSVGLLGTIIGLIIMIVGAFSSLDIADQESIKQALVAISSGIGTALVTTLVGLICSLLLQLQIIVVKGSWKARNV